MTRKTWLRSSIAAALVTLPLIAGCYDPPPNGPGGGPSSGTTGSTNEPGVGPSGPGTGGGGGGSMSTY